MRWRGWPRRWAAPKVAHAGQRRRPETGRGALTPEAVAATVGALMPEDAVIADESVTFGRGFFADTKAAPPHDWLNVTGGAIGGGMPMATGAAIGAPGRRVINLQADGSAMYTVQALWTQAREKLDVTTVLLSNRKYQILLGELANVGANPGRTALDMMDIGNPDINWPALAGSMGVEAARTDTAEGFADLLRPFAQAVRAVPDRTGDLNADRTVAGKTWHRQSPLDRSHKRAYS